MIKTKAEATIDVILLGLVPKIVDRNPETLRDTKKYWKYAQAQADEFLAALTILPAAYTAGLTKRIFRKEKSAAYTCDDSPIGLSFSFRPEFNIFLRKEVIACPLYDLMFKHVEPNPADDPAIQPTPRIIEAALKHFFLYQQDMDAGTLKVAGFRGRERVLEDLPLLGRYLTKGTIVEARTDCAGVGQARYRI